MADDFDATDDSMEIVSKSQRKREMAALRKLAQQLIALPETERQRLQLPEDLDDHISQAKAMTKGALKRQTGFIGGLLADHDHQRILRQLDALRQPHQQATAQLHQAEQWRDALIAGDGEVMTSLYQRFAGFDGQYVRQLVSNARREQKNQKPPKSSRELFRYLQQCLEADNT